MNIYRSNIKSAFNAILLRLQRANDVGELLAEMRGTKEAIEAGLPHLVDRYGLDSHEVRGAEFMLNELDRNS